MTDLDVTMGERVELSAPSGDDKRLVDSIKHAPSVEEEAADDLPEGEDDDDLQVKEVIDDKKIFKQGEEEEVVEEQPPPKPKKQATTKQREHLKKAREKALETRKKNAVARKVLADEKKAERDEKRKEKELKIISKEDREFKQKKAQPPLASPTPVAVGKSFTEEEIMSLQQKAIETYETKRKARKEVKKKEQHKIAQDKKTYEVINNAINPDPNDLVWGQCFQ
jgi:hypothetical protein